MTTDPSGEDVYVEANGLRHHLLRYGDTDASDLLILPGITSPAVTAGFIAVRLAQLGYCIYVPDLPGRGETPPTASGKYRLVDYAADVAELIDSLGLSKPVIIGHSLGARIAAAYATQYAPENHELVILVDPPTSGPGRPPYPMSWESFQTQLEQARAGTTAEEVRAFFPHWPERELQIRAEVLASCDEQAVHETHIGFETEDFFECWRQLSPPAVLVRGSDSPVVPHQAATELREVNPAIEIIDVPDAGHMVPWDNLSGFFDAITPVLINRQGHARTDAASASTGAHAAASSQEDTS